MTVLSFNELIPVSHGMAKEKGWYSDVPEGGKRCRLEILNNFHSEISEAWEEYRGNRLLPWYESEVGLRFSVPYENVHEFPEGRKPEGFGVEIVDYIIRLADFAGSIGIDDIGSLSAD